MENRGPIARLVLMGLAGIALVLLARWLLERSAGSSEAPDGPRPLDARQ